MENQDFHKRTTIKGGPFHFHCHPQVSCFLTCCHNVDMFLYPYDLLRLKERLNISSEKILQKYTRISEGSHPFFPGLMLQLRETEGKPCPFLEDSGCSVYLDRPSACRTYPLERGVERSPQSKALKVHYFMTHHPYCKGHDEERTYTVKQWERDQGLHEYNLQNDLWAEMDAFFATNPWKGEGHAGPLQQLAFMVCYNIDAFRQYVKEHQIIQQYRVDKATKQRLRRNDDALLLFGYQWLLAILGGKSQLIRR